MSRRLKEDLAGLKKLFSRGGLIKDFDLADDGDLLTCRFVHGKVTKGYTFQVSDYPDTTVLIDDEDPVLLDGNLAKIFDKIVTDLAKKHTLKKDQIYGNEKDVDSDSSNEAESDDSVDDLRTSQNSATSWRTGSRGSFLGDDDDDDDDMDEYDYDDVVGDYANDQRWMDNDAILLDLHNYKVVYGENMVTVRGMPLLEQVDIELMCSPLDMLSPQTAAAWGVDVSTPIHLKVSFNDSAYTDTHKATTAMEIFQLVDGKKGKFGLKGQLENIVRNFLRDNWPAGILQVTKLSTSDVNEAKNKEATEKRADSTGRNNLKKSGGTSFIHHLKAPTTPEDDCHVDVDLLQRLVDMGFPQEPALDALRSKGNNFDTAMAHLLGDDESSTSSKKSAPAVKVNVSRPTADKTSTGKVDASDIIKNPHKAIKAEKHGGIRVTSEFGFLVQLMTYMRERVPKLNDYCVICDQPHVFAAGNMLKPAVCSRELCCWSFQQLRVGADSAEDIATEAEVIDLLVRMAQVAAKSARSNTIFEPFPTVFDPAKPDHPVLSPQTKNFSLVNEILSTFPSVQSMVQSRDFGDMKSRMDAAHRLAFPLLQWIISSNRSHIVRLMDENTIKSMRTQHQYLLLSAPPEKEERFRELKATHGSCFAFHGSSVENWHSIMRRGLVNASGTALQVNGAAYGNGIYLSPNASTSFGYSRIHQSAGQINANAGSNRFLASENMHCIAICEVINHDIRRSGSIWVQPHEDHVVTRFFCVYNTSVGSDAMNCSTENSSFIAEIEGAINFHANRGASS